MQRLSEEQIGTDASDGMSMDRSVIALAHRVELNKSGWRPAYISMLVESAINSTCSSSGGMRENISDIIQSVKRSSGVSLLKAEVKDAVIHLEKSGKVSNSEPGFLKIAPNEASRLAEVESEWISLENRVRDEWLSDLSQRYPEHAQSELEVLWTPLRQEFLSRVLARNGADAYRLLSGSHARVEAIAADGFSYSDILNKTIAGLPEKYQSLARTEFPAFVRAGGDRGDYLTGLVSNAFNTLSLALPKEVLEEVYGQRKRVLTLLLDTNFVFSAFGLHSNPFNEAAQDILQIIERIRDDSNGKLLIDMRCDPSTIEEFRWGLKARAQVLGGRAFDIKTAAALVDNSNLPGIERSYCQRIVESGVSLTMDEFVQPYLESTEKLLAQKGIQVTAYSLPDSGPLYDEIKNDEEDWYQAVKDTQGYRGPEPIKHDVSLWHRVRRLQPDVLAAGQTDFFARKAYLLTCDWHMIGFDQLKARKSKTDELVCILPPTFLQTLTLFIPRTDDFSSALLQSLRMPISNADARATEDAMRRILRVIAAYEPLGEVAVEVLSDRALAEAVKGVENPDDVKALVDSAIARENARLREQLELATRQNAVAPSTPPAVEHGVNTDRDEIQQLNKKIDELTVALATAERARVGELDRKKDRQMTFWLFAKAIGTSTLIGTACYFLLRAYVSASWGTELFKGTTAVLVVLLSLYVQLRKYVSPKIEKVWGVINTLIDFFAVLKWIFGPR